jgi:cytoskeletal protein CcmA (bactofilin family)
MLKIFTKMGGADMMPKLGDKDDSEFKAYVGEGVEFEGALTFNEGAVRIDGKFKGKVNTKDTLIIGETGRITAEITVGTIICKGKVEGTISASKKVELVSSSHVVGDVRTPVLTMEVGSVLDGNCHMSGNEESKIIELIKNEGSESDLISAE